MVFFKDLSKGKPQRAVELYIIIDWQEKIMPKNGREDELGSQGLSALVNNKKALKIIEEGGGGHLRVRF